MSPFEEVSGYYRMQDSICFSSDVIILMEELSFSTVPKKAEFSFVYRK